MPVFKIHRRMLQVPIKEIRQLFQLQLKPNLNQLNLAERNYKYANRKSKAQNMHLNCKPGDFMSHADTNDSTFYELVSCPNSLWVTSEWA